MQEDHAGSNGGASSTCPGYTGGFLEDPDRVAYMQVGETVAHFEGVLPGVHKYSQGAKFILYPIGEVWWTHYSAMLLLQGMPVQRLLGPEHILVKGEHLPVYSPRPGMRGVVLANVVENPFDLSSIELLGHVLKATPDLANW